MVHEDDPHHRLLVVTCLGGVYQVCQPTSGAGSVVLGVRSNDESRVTAESGRNSDPGAAVVAGRADETQGTPRGTGLLCVERATAGSAGVVGRP